MKKLIIILFFLYIKLNTFAQLNSQVESEYDSQYKLSENLVHDACKRFKVSKENIIFSIRIKEDIYPKKLSTKHDTIIEAFEVESERTILYSVEEEWVLSCLYPTEEIYYKLYREYLQKHEKYWNSSGVTWDCGGNSRYHIGYYEKPQKKWYEIFVYEWEEESTLYYILDENLRVTRKGKY